MNCRLKVSNLILRKSIKLYWRLVILFLLVWIIILTYISFAIFNLSSHAENFYNNALAHIIEVKGCITDHKYKKLDNYNVEIIYDLLDKESIEYDSTPLCKIANGILIESSQEGIALYGICKSNSNILKNYDNNSNVLYSNLPIEKIKLIIPEINVDTEGNFFSNSCNTYEYEIENLDNELIEDLIINNQDDMIAFFADQKTFSDIVTIMYKEENRLDLTKLEELIIYVNNINDISSTKLMLEENGYFVSYAFSTFESLPTFIVKSSIFHVVVLVLLIVFSMICVFISYKNYINAQKKDMGVLKHFGYSNDEIMNIYLWPLKIDMLILLGVAFVFNFIQYKEWFFGGLVTLFMILLVCIMYNVIKYCIIKKYVSKDIIDLVKYDKDFE